MTGEGLKHTHWENSEVQNHVFKNVIRCLFCLLMYLCICVKCVGLKIIRLLLGRDGSRDALGGLSALSMFEIHNESVLMQKSV